MRNTLNEGVCKELRWVEGMSSIILYRLALGIGGNAENFKIFTSLRVFCIRIRGFTQIGFSIGERFDFGIMLVNGSWSWYSKTVLGLRGWRFIIY